MRRSASSRWRTIFHMAFFCKQDERSSRCRDPERQRIRPDWQRGRRAVYRRWIKLISAGWLPHFIFPSRGYLALNHGDHAVACSQKNLEDSPHRARCRVTDQVEYKGLAIAAPYLTEMTRITNYRIVQAGCSRVPMSQINPHSSRAIAAQVLF